MQIGKPLRTVVVEPLELLVQDPKAKLESVPAPQLSPKQVPVAR
jgi:hypothetical protein